MDNYHILSMVIPLLNLYILLKTYKNGDGLDLNVSAYADGMVK